MTHRYSRVAVPLGLFFLNLPAPSQTTAWHDPSPHRIQFVTVEENVRLEVLEWSGPGRNVVLLAGSGNSAHVFDEFAPKLAKRWRVYAITRRGYGASSQPASGYGDQRLTDDVFQVIDPLGIAAPFWLATRWRGVN